MRIVWSIALGALALRLLFLAAGPGGWDDVDFALGMQSYDLAAMQPHFPGYPVYMLVAFAFGKLVENPFRALSLLSAAASAVSVFPLYCIVKRISGKSIALFTALLWAVAPLSVVLGTQPLSDSFGTLLALCLVASSLRAADARVPERSRALALLLAGVWLGLLYGVRISYIACGAIPICAAWVYGRDTRRYGDIAGAVSAALLVCAAWSYALVLNVGGSISGLWKLALSFTGGHFSDWGGTYTGSGTGERLFYWIFRQWLAAGIGTPGYGQHEAGILVALFVCVSLAGWLTAMRYRKQIKGKQADYTGIWLIAVWLVPYGLWAFFAQNIEKPRHILPLLPLLVWGLVWGLHRMPRAALLTGMLAAAMLAVSITQVKGQAQTPSPLVQLADYMAAGSGQDQVVLYTYEEERVTRYRHPKVTTVRLRKWDDFRTSVLGGQVAPERIMLTDSVLAGFNRPDLMMYMKERTRFTGNPWLYPTYHTIVLYEIKPEMRAAWQRMVQKKGGGKNGVTGVFDYISGGA